MAEVYWAARDLASSPVGNHQYIVIMLNDGETLPGIQTQQENGKNFVTLGGHVSGSIFSGGSLVYIGNQRDDVIAVKESLNSSLRGYFSDFDLEKHRVTPPSSGDRALADQIKGLAEKYAVNTRDNPVSYGLFSQNCSTWVNTIMKIVGIAESERARLGDFRGVDRGQNNLLDENLFK